MLDDIRWEFGSRRYLSLEQFVTEVSRVNKSAWPHDEIVMNNPKEAYSVAGEIGFSWWLVEHYSAYHVNCPDGCDSGEPARGR